MLRHIKKSVFTTSLNIIGLSVAFAAFFIILVQVKYDLGFNKGFADSDRIFRVEGAFNLANMSVYSNCVSRPISLRFGACSPNITVWGVYSGDNYYSLQRTESDDAPFFSVNCSTIQKELLDVFSFQIIAGDTTEFHTNQALISKATAEKLFPGESPLGKVLRDKEKHEMTIIGVYKDFPENCCIHNGIMLDLGDKMLNDYSEWSVTMFVKLNSAANSSEVEKRLMDEMYDMYKDDEEVAEAFNSGATSNMLRLTPISDTHFSKDVQYDWIEKASLSTTYSLLTIAILVIIIAIINFINFSMASVPMTIKSINTRKVLGCTNVTLRIRQINEAVAISLISLLVGILLVFILGGTSFTSFISGSIALKDNMGMVLLAAAIAIFTGIFAGIYPAIYSTSFSPAMVIKGSFSLSPKGRFLRSSLVALQYVISLVLISVAFFINVQSDFMKGYDMGYRSDNILTVSLPYAFSDEKAEVLSQKLKANPDIPDVTFAAGMIISNGKMGWGRTYKGKQIKFDCFPVAPNFLKFFGMKMVDGRDFEPEDAQKVNGTLILNETAMKTYPILQLGDKYPGHHPTEQSDFVGVAKDFNFEPLHKKINPIGLYVFGTEPWWNLSMCYIKVAPMSVVKENLEFITKTFKEVFPTIDNVEINFMDDNIGRLYQKEDSLGRLIIIFCGLSVLISIIGILGLIYFETQFKKKEIGVRRVFGSSVGNILMMLNFSYIKIATICFVISIPISLIIIKQWLKTFKYQAAIPVWIFLAAYIIILSITILVITLQSYRAAAANPVDSVRAE